MGTYQQVSGYENATGAGAELPHNQVSLLLVHVTVLEDRAGVDDALGDNGTRPDRPGEELTRADTVKSLPCIFSVSQSTFLLVLMKMTACVMVSVSYRSHSVSSFHSWAAEGDSVSTRSTRRLQGKDSSTPLPPSPR